MAWREVQHAAWMPLFKNSGMRIAEKSSTFVVIGGQLE